MRASMLICCVHDLLRACKKTACAREVRSKEALNHERELLRFLNIEAHSKIEWLMRAVLLTYMYYIYVLCADISTQYIYVNKTALISHSIFEFRSFMDESFFTSMLSYEGGQRALIHESFYVDLLCVCKKKINTPMNQHKSSYSVMSHI